jgi:Methyltransferase domain
MSFFSRIADHRHPSSLASHLRARRLEFFEHLLSEVPSPVTILDIGGTASFWQTLKYTDDRVKVTLLNIWPEAMDDPRFESLVGDARDLSAFGDRSIDIVYSNSVIEHVGSFDDQRKMAAEIRRVAKRYFVQTPSFWFPLEPHFLVPGFQFMPVELRAFLLTQSRLGWVPRERDRRRAREIASSIRLLTTEQMRTLFPDAIVHHERFIGMTKSVVLYHGW